MSPIKRVLCSQRLRQVPAQFSWVDHRLVRDKYICRCGPEALALYLALVTVGDAEGLSYYSDTSVGRLLSMSPAGVARVRRELVEAGLIAYSKPVYQVLSLPEPPRWTLPAESTPESRAGEARSLGQILGAIRGDRK